MIKGDRIKLVKKMGVFDNIGEICEVTDIQEGGVICFKFGGCHLGCMSYNEYENYFEKVEEPVKKTWDEWGVPFKMIFHDIRGSQKTIVCQTRTNGKKVQIRSGSLKAEATCCQEDEFDFEKGLELVRARLVVKYLDNQIKSIAKAM